MPKKTEAVDIQAEMERLRAELAANEERLATLRAQEAEEKRQAAEEEFRPHVERLRASVDKREALVAEIEAGLQGLIPLAKRLARMGRELHVERQQVEALARRAGLKVPAWAYQLRPADTHEGMPTLIRSIMAEEPSGADWFRLP